MFTFYLMEQPTDFMNYLDLVKMTKNSKKHTLPQINYEEDDKITLIIYENLLSGEAKVLNFTYEWKNMNREEREIIKYWNYLMYDEDTNINN